MKKIFYIATIIAIIIVTILSTTVFAYAAPYKTYGAVIDIDKENDVVFFEDTEGFVWAIEEVEDWMIGDIACIMMDNCETEQIEDDVIISARYIGYIYAMPIK